MTWLDRYLQRLRFNAVAPWIPSGARVLDVGSGDGSLLVALGSRIGPSVAIDPVLAPREDLEARHTCVIGRVEDLSPDEHFDVACAVAMFEHLDEVELSGIAAGLFARIVPGGVLVAMIPAPLVDRILEVLIGLRLVAAQSFHEHHGADPERIAEVIQASGFVLRHHRRFELGLNHCFVFDRPTSPQH